MRHSKILILVPGDKTQGGVINYYKALRTRFSSNIHYFTRGARSWPRRGSVIFELARIFFDVIRFFIKLLLSRDVLVQTTTSFSSLALFRDGLFIIIAKLMRKKVIVFYRGWDEELAKVIENKYLFLFRMVFFRADAIIELSSYNVSRLRRWGYTKEIYLETTLVDDVLVTGVDEHTISMKYSDIGVLNILYMARVERIKGIYIALEAYAELRKEYKNKVEFQLAGDGLEMDMVKNYILDNKIEGVSIHGFVQGEEKKELLNKAHLFLFPTMHGEGMPNSLLEALAVGLPVVTRPMGGSADILENGLHGFVTTSTDSKDYYILLKNLIDNPQIMNEIGTRNYNYAKERFYASKVVKRIENIFNEVLIK